MITCKVTDANVRSMFTPEAARKAQAAVVENVRSDTERFVPYRTGYLSDISVDVSRAEEGYISWRAPYAARVYHMKGNVNWTRTRHPEAGPQWVERSKAVNGERWKRIAVAAAGGNA